MMILPGELIPGFESTVTGNCMVGLLIRMLFASISRITLYCVNNPRFERLYYSHMIRVSIMIPVEKD